jgi:hypothetical protein
MLTVDTLNIITANSKRMPTIKLLIELMEASVQQLLVPCMRFSHPCKVLYEHLAEPAAVIDIDDIVCLPQNRWIIML